jgi:hypothetical protein
MYLSSKSVHRDIKKALIKIVLTLFSWKRNVLPWVSVASKIALKKNFKGDFIISLGRWLLVGTDACVGKNNKFNS